MGDKGGKKDKEKNKQQQVTKQKQEEQKKHDKGPAKNSVAGSAKAIAGAANGRSDQPIARRGNHERRCTRPTDRRRAGAAVRRQYPDTHARGARANIGRPDLDRDPVHTWPLSRRAIPMARS